MKRPAIPVDVNEPGATKQASTRLLSTSPRRVLLHDPAYSLYGEFNESLDANGVINIGGYDYLPSEILYKTDPDAYRDLFNEWKHNQREWLETQVDKILTHRQSHTRYNQLARQVINGHVIPFVGAGLSIPCGNPGWSDFLQIVAQQTDLDTSAMQTQLQNGEFEEVAEKLIERLEEELFNEAIENEFMEPVELKGPILHIPRLASCGIITTNFDRVLEKALTEADYRFDKALGLASETLIRALARGERVLLKLHGEAHDPKSRVLTLKEYHRAYGAGQIDFTLPLPYTLELIFATRTLLFLGCSLYYDRTMALFETVVSRKKGVQLAKHFAIVEKPTQEEKILERERFLAKRNIYPIWYPNGDHKSIDLLLRLLIHIKEAGE